MCLSAADQIKDEFNKEVEVVDLRSLLPLDDDAIIKSVKKTNRVLIVHEDKVYGGFGGEVAALITNKAFEYLDAPVSRVGATFTPVGFNKILEKAIIAYASILPEPTKENCIYPNTHILLDIRDEYFKYADNPTKDKLERAVWKIFITEYEHDHYYGDRISFGIEKAANSEWKPRSVGHPVLYWNEPEPYGGGYLIKDETLKKYARRFKNLGG